MEEARWGFEKELNRGFADALENDGTRAKKAAKVHSMLTKIASYAPKSIMREITRRTKSWADVWNIASDWAGISQLDPSILIITRSRRVTSEMTKKKPNKSSSTD